MNSKTNPGRALSDREGSNQPHDINDLLDFVPEAIVSRVLMKTDSGSVTLFAFWQGQGLSEHISPHDALVQILEGHATIIIENNEHSVAAGQVLLLPAQRPHSVLATEKIKMLLTILKS